MHTFICWVKAISIQCYGQNRTFFSLIFPLYILLRLLLLSREAICLAMETTLSYTQQQQQCLGLHRMMCIYLHDCNARFASFQENHKICVTASSYACTIHARVASYGSVISMSYNCCYKAG